MESTDNFAYLLPFIFFCFGAVFIVLPRWNACVSTRYWGIGFVSAALGFCEPMVLSAAPVKLGAMIAEFFFLCAYLSYGHAVLARFGLASRYVLARLALWLVAMAALFCAVVIMENLRAEMIISDFSCALQLTVPLWLCRRHIARPIDRLLAAMAGLVVLDAGSRSIVTLVLTSAGTYPTLDSFFSSDYAYFTQVSASIIGFLLALSVLGASVFDIVSQHRHLAEHDPLTELLNRRGFERLMPDFRPGTFPAGAVVVCDIDHFKTVNDQFGHAAGDGVIIALASVLQESLPAGSMITRFGGEEFVAYLPDVGLDHAEHLANIVRAKFELREWLGSGIDRRITASFGVSAIARGDHSVHDAIKRADVCLYGAKAGGRNQVVAEGNRAAAPGPALRIVPKT